MLIHKSLLGKYLCNQAVKPISAKLSDDWSSVTCKNCLKRNIVGTMPDFTSIYKRLDFSRNITPTSIDRNLLDSKYRLVEDWLKNGNSDALKLILADITMFSYAFFKINNKPVKLYPYQDLILNDKHKYKIFRSARQLGKSLALDIKAAYNLLLNHGHAHNECIISKSLPQATFQMKRVKGLLNSMDKINWREDRGDSESMSVLSIDVKNEKGKVMYTNMLVVAPCTEGALGYDFHEVNLDETEYWDIDLRYFWNNIIEPTTYATDGCITSFSNPNGNDTYIAELERLHVNDKRKYHVYVFSFLDRPGATQEKFDNIAADKTRQEIESQLLAIRSMSDTNFFTPEEIEKSIDKNVKETGMVGRQPYFFLDVGAKHDQSVLCGGYFIDEDYNGKTIRTIYVPIIKCYPVGYPVSLVVAGPESTDANEWPYHKSVKEYLREFPKDGVQPLFGCDVTGNSGISPLFREMGINPIDITMSHKTKSAMYQNYKYFMERNLLKHVPSKEWEYQARHLEIKKTKTGLLTIHHRNEKDLDDTQDAMAGLVYMINSPHLVPVSLTVVTDYNKDTRKNINMIRR